MEQLINAIDFLDIWIGILAGFAIGVYTKGLNYKLFEEKRLNKIQAQLDESILNSNDFIQVITECSECPACDEADMLPSGFYCKLADNTENENKIIEDDGDYNPITPDWCPLKSSPVKLQWYKIDDYE